MKIAIGNDHAGVEMKKSLMTYLADKYGHEFLNIGTDTEDSVDYPVIGRQVAGLVADGSAVKGIIICGTGIGISMAANKVKGIRAALCTTEFDAEMASKHNDANVLSLGARTTSIEDAIKIADVWITTDFEGGRHQRRVDLIEG